MPQYTGTAITMYVHGVYGERIPRALSVLGIVLIHAHCSMYICSVGDHNMQTIQLNKKKEKAEKNMIFEVFN